jgi:DNA-binding Lrp family transcriptional regulator
VTDIETVGGDDSPIHGYDPRTARIRVGVRRVGMAISAYVLIQTEVGKAAQVAEAVRAISGVVAADDVTGPYDVIVRTEAPSLDDLGKLVVSQIQAVEGITRTFTCPVVNL